jgi:very-short-patch-repair endonuclease
MKKLGSILSVGLHKVLSPAEKRMLEYLYAFDVNKLLHYETNYKVGPYLIDIAFIEDKIGLEIDGHAYHTSAEQIARDQLRDQYLTEVEGWKMERVPGWFAYRYPGLAVFKAIRHIERLKDTSLYQHMHAMLLQWNVREAANEGDTDAVERYARRLHNSS